MSLLIAVIAPAANAAVTLSPCDIPGIERGEARCGTYEVYEDREARRGRALGLKVVVLGATDGEPRPDPLFFVNGGPGQGSSALAGVLSKMLAEIRRERDLVLVDLRGTGGSNPLNCRLPGSDEDPQAYLGEFLPIESIRDCLEHLDADPALYTTPIAADDLDEVRAAMGYEKVNLYGLSYGSRLALVYLRRHGAHVRSAVLYGAVPTHMKIPLHQPADAERALGLLFDECEADAACASAYPDLRKKFDTVRERLSQGPVDVKLDDGKTGKKIRVKIDLELFNEEMRWRLYDEESNLVPRLVQEAYDGDFKTIAGLLLRLRRATASGAMLAVGTYLSVTCTEDIPFIDPEQARRRAADTFFGHNRYDQQARACEVWPRGELSAGFTDDVSSEVPVLVVSGHRDPVTPPRWGERVVKHLPNGRHVVLRQGFHGLLTPCAGRMVGAFVSAGSAAGLDTSCAKEVAEIPFVLPPGVAGDVEAKSALAELAADPQGLWEGVIFYRRGMIEIEIETELAEDHQGEMGGTISVPSQGLRYIPLEGFQVDGSKVAFTFTRYSPRMEKDIASPFKGAISADGQTIEGTFLEGGVNAHPFTLWRVGDAGVERPKPEPPALHDLSDQGEELIDLFNKDSDKVRVVLMVSPTCPLCMMNARMVQRYVMNKMDDERLRVYAVWGPMQENEARKDAVTATVNLVDDRVTHFWTPKHTLAEAYMKPLGLENDHEPAWDTYLVYGSGVRWERSPPVPTFFMYVEKALLPEDGVLNVETIAEKVRELLSGAAAPGHSAGE